MKTNVPIKKQRIETKTQPPDIQRRINGGWLRLWRTVYPNTPPPQTVQSLKSKVQSPADRRPAAVERLATFLSVWLALVLLATGCAGPRPLKGGRAVTTRKPAGIVEQTLVQGENPSQASRQDQESVKVRTYTLPVGSRIEQSETPGTVVFQPASPTSASHQPSTIDYQPSSAFILSAPMPVVEREETHAGTELGAAQKKKKKEKRE